MERSQYFLVNTAAQLLQSFPGSAQTDNVTITIYDVDDAATDVNAVAMTAIANESWRYSWTPSETHTYLIKFSNQTIQVDYFLYAVVTGVVVGVPVGGSGTTLVNLRSRFLRLIDNYNANDLTGTNSSGDVADLCINDGLQTIYSKIKASRFTQQYSSTALASTADQAYIELSAITDIDEIVAIKDTANQWKLREISPDQYFRSVPSPASVTGTPHEYCRILNRVYLNPRPTSVITYTTEYRRSYGRLSSDSDAALIPSKYDRWIMAEAWVIWLMGEDPNAVSAIQIAQVERQRSEDIFMNDMFSDFDRIPLSGSHFLENEERGWLPYDNPIT